MKEIVEMAKEDMKVILNNGWVLAVDFLDETNDYRVDYISKQSLEILLNRLKGFIEDFGIPQKHTNFLDEESHLFIEDIVVFLDKKEIQIYFKD